MAQDARFFSMALLGVGYMGGSLAKAAKRAGVVSRVVGFDSNAEATRLALAAGVIDAIAERAEDVATGCDLVVLAAPVAAMGPLAAAMAPQIAANALVIDIGSVKGPVVEAVIASVAEHQFVPCHPLAGAEKTGVGAATADLFVGRPCVLCPGPAVTPENIDRAKDFWRAIGAEPVTLPLAEHDPLVAALSHLPHVVAFALAGTVEPDGTRLASVLPGGTLTSSLRDTTRVAASSPQVWRDIFLMNREHVLPLIDRFAAAVDGLRAAIHARDGAALESLLSNSRNARRKLFGD